MSRSEHPGSPVFNTTQWTVIGSAGSEESTAAVAALEHLCTAYWSPVYAFARCTGSNAEDALDLTQGFFERLIAGKQFVQADKARGRFRSFLLVSFKNYVSNQRAKANAVRRGGRVTFVPIDQSSAESSFRIEPVDRSSPDRAFDRQWALTLLDAVMDDLRAFYLKRGDVTLFETLQPCLATGRDRHSYAELGENLQMSEGTVKVAVHRMRKRYRGLLRKKVMLTVDSSKAVEIELRHLFQALAK
jgi:RNA polymerase sigma-70 factor (ECF subfamily)